MARSASSIKELEESLSKVTEQKSRVDITLYEYKLENKNLQEKPANQQLTSLSALREYKRADLNVQQLRDKMELLTTAKPKLVSTSRVVIRLVDQSQEIKCLRLWSHGTWASR